MKQRITIDQLNELSNEQKERLREWWKPQIFDTFYEEIKWSNEDDSYIDVIDRDTYEPSPKTLPLLSIGQMIEIVGIMKTAQICNEVDEKMELDNIEGYLCDALWQSVKKVL